MKLRSLNSCELERDPVLVERLYRFRNSFPVALQGEPKLCIQEKDGSLLAALWTLRLSPYNGEVEFSFAVHRAYRKQGIASFLLSHFLSTCQERRVVCSPVHVATRRIIERLGFQPNQEEAQLFGADLCLWEWHAPNRNAPQVSLRGASIRMEM